MDYVLVVGVICVIAFISSRINKTLAKDEAEKEIVVHKKACPPHKWEYKRMVDQKGNLLDEVLVCSTCHQTPSSAINGI